MTPERARQIWRWWGWRDGGCGCLGAAPPPYPNETPDERRWLREQWESLPGTSCLADVLLRVMQGKQENSTRHELPTLQNMP